MATISDPAPGTLQNTFSTSDTDTLGEILNISMGAAASAISSMLERKVTISTPRIELRGFSVGDFYDFDPAVLVKIFYVEGIEGRNVMVFRVCDMQTILGLLMGDTSEPDGRFVFDELSISAACEVMNQMMGASATALSEILSRLVNISPPEAVAVETGESFSAAAGVSEGDEVVSVGFRLKIDGVMDTDFISILQIDLAKDIVSHVTKAQEILISDIPNCVRPPVPNKKPKQNPVSQAPASAPAPAKADTNHMRVSPHNAAIKEQRMASLNDEVSVQETKFPQFAPNKAPVAATGTNMDLLMNVALDVSVEIGKTKRKIKEIVDFGQGTVIELNKQAGAPVDIVVNGCLLARGDVVVIDDNFGVRITEIVGSKELMESLSEQNEAE